MDKERRTKLRDGDKVELKHAFRGAMKLRHRSHVN